MFAARNALMTGKAGGDLYFASVSALLHGDGTNNSTTITDSSSNAANWTAYTNAKLSTSTKKYGSASISFDATAATYIKPAASTNLVLGTGDFTVELWVFFNSLGVTPCLYDWRPVGQAVVSPVLMLSYGGNSNKMTYYAGSGTSAVIAGTTTIATGTWYHVAISRASSVTRMFVNGVQEGSNYSDTINYAENQPTFGNLGYDPSGLVSTYGFNGYLDDIRITKGVARYTTTFTAPTAALPDA